MRHWTDDAIATAWLVALLVFCCGCVALYSGCATVLPVVSAGLDGAEGVLKVQCPQRTPTCEKELELYNGATLAYNSAVLANAVGEDASVMEQQGLAKLKELWAMLVSGAK